MAKVKQGKGARIMLSVFRGIVVLLAIAILYIAVIMGQASESAMGILPEKQALLSAQIPSKVTQEADITFLLDSFPAPIMRFTKETPTTFESGSAYDVAYQGAFARMVDLSYVWEGERINLRSIYPRDAYALIATRGYGFSAKIGYQMLNLNCVRMDSQSTIRFHVQGEHALYLLEMPLVLRDKATLIIKQLQLEILLS